MLRVLSQHFEAAPYARQVDTHAGRRQRFQQQITITEQIGLVQRPAAFGQPAIVPSYLRNNVLIVRMGRQLPSRNALWKRWICHGNSPGRPRSKLLRPRWRIDEAQGCELGSGCKRATKALAAKACLRCDWHHYNPSPGPCPLKWAEVTRWLCRMQGILRGRRFHRTGVYREFILCYRFPTDPHYGCSACADTVISQKERHR